MKKNTKEKGRNETTIDNTLNTEQQINNLNKMLFK